MLPVRHMTATLSIMNTVFKNCAVPRHMVSRATRLLLVFLRYQFLPTRIFFLFFPAAYPYATGCQ